MADFTERSVNFNLTVSALFLLKALLAARFRNQKSFSLLRQVFIERLSVDCLVILPSIMAARVTTATFTYNYILVLLILVGSELTILLANAKYLAQKSRIEVIEQLQPSQAPDFISHFNLRTKSVVAFINTWKASKYLVGTLGD